MECILRGELFRLIHLRKDRFPEVFIILNEESIFFICRCNYPVNASLFGFRVAK